MALNQISSWFVREFKKHYEEADVEHQEMITRILKKILGTERTEAERLDILEGVGIGMFRRVICSGHSEFRAIIFEMLDWPMIMEQLSSDKAFYGV